MLKEVTLATASLARLAALRPIHFAIITCLLGSVAYLAVVDEYIPGSFQHPQVMFYHPPGTTEYGDWVRVEDSTPYESADQYVILPLKFHSYRSASVPEIKGAIVTFPSPTRRLYLYGLIFIYYSLCIATLLTDLTFLVHSLLIMEWM